MKKMIFTVFIILFLPTFLFAYSKYIIPGGQSIGININTDGLLVVSYYKVNGEYINRNIHVSDRIISVNEKQVSSVSELMNILNNDISNNDIINVKLARNDKIIETEILLKEEKGVLKTGLYVKDNVTGLGTITYIDPISKVYGSLGHEIVLNDSNSKIEVKNGNIFESIVKNITKSRNGYVGSKNASIIFDKKIGTVEKNISSGVYGFYTSNISSNTMEIADFNEINKGEAYILTVTKNNTINKYKIKILEKYSGKKNTSKAFGFQIVDTDLLNTSGGIVQGMSGSPIIQNNKIIGAVTNVVVDDVSLGYGISIITMLEEGDKLVK